MACLCQRRCRTRKMYDMQQYLWIVAVLWLSAATSEQFPLETATTSIMGMITADTASLLRRDDGSCSYGSCAGVCLSQGAFCCNPGGTTNSPNCELGLVLLVVSNE